MVLTLINNTFRFLGQYLRVLFIQENQIKKNFKKIDILFMSSDANKMSKVDKEIHFEIILAKT